MPSERRYVDPASGASDLALASLVALRPDRIGTTCPAWIESAGRVCGRPQTVGLLCARHRKAAESRWADAVEREKACLARSVASAREIETKRARLADLDTEIARLDPPDTGDLAAFAGKVHPSITRQRNAHLTDTRVARLARVCVEAERLRAWLEAVS